DGFSFTSDIVGLGFNEPGGGFQPDFRGFGRALSASGPTFGIALDVVNEFCLYWSAKDKTLRGTVAGQAISVANPGVPADAKVNAVFAGSFHVGSGSAQACELYVDDFTYSLWEAPSLIDVSLTTPLAYSAYPPGTSLTLSAEATEEGGSITKVEFFVQSNNATNKVGEASAAPYSAQWAAEAVGDFQIKAVATTATGKTEQSIEVPVSIVAPTTTQTIQEKFATNLGVFDIVVRNQYLDGDFGWRDSANALGEAGEFGGAFPGVGFGDAAYIGAGLKALLLPSQHSLTLAGKVMMLPPPNSAQQVFLGYVNTADLVYEHDFGLVFEADEQTVILKFPGVTVDPMTLPIDQPFTFDLTWDVQQKKLLGILADMPIDITVDAVTPVAFDAMVLGAFGPNGTSRDNVSLCYVDDLSFTRAKQSAPPPKLSVAQQGNSITLSWQGAEFRLQERTSLSSGAWADSSAAVVTAGDSHTATIVPEGAARFYRLAK
ncbi:MAG TPA: Ig-like domain-containing protein, partial [Candidatus Paceibacterota bacterium]|nr:Ig-like domain-containing protein [Candidatus Paceibacterota bacterium]